MSATPHGPRCIDAVSTPPDEVAQRVAAAIAAGGIVVMPTETVYGVAVADTASALASVVACKQREAAKPIALMAASLAGVAAHLAERGAALPVAARRLAQRFWPGPLTMVLGPAGATEGYRVPDHALARRILEACGGILRVTSANRSGEPDACTASEAWMCLGAAVTLVVDDGPVRGGVPSTVIRIDDDNRLTILREGPILCGELDAALKEANT